MFYPRLKILKEGVAIPPELSSQYLTVQKQIADKEGKKGQLMKQVQQIDNEINILQKNIIAIESKASQMQVKNPEVQQQSQEVKPQQQTQNAQQTENANESMNESYNPDQDEYFTAVIELLKRDFKYDFDEVKYLIYETPLHDLVLNNYINDIAAFETTKYINNLFKKNNEEDLYRCLNVNEYLNYKDVLKPKSEEEILDIIEKSGMSPNELLLKSAKNGFTKGVQMALDRGANVHAKNDDALLCAAYYGHYNVIKLLLDNGANVHIGNDDALIYTAENGQLNIVKLLLDNGANIHAWDDEALRWAAQNGHYDIVKLLLDNGANIHAENDEALRWATEEGHKDVVELLLDNGANIHANDDYALRLAAENGHENIVRLLKSYMNKLIESSSYTEYYNCLKINEKNEFNLFSDISNDKSDVEIKTPVEIKDFENDKDNEGIYKDEYLFYIKLIPTDEEPILAKIYKLNENKRWEITVLEGDGSSLTNMEFTKDYDKVEIISYLADLYDEIEEIDKIDADDEIDDKPELDHKYYELEESLEETADEYNKRSSLIKVFDNQVMYDGDSKEVFPDEIKNVGRTYSRHSSIGKYYTTRVYLSDNTSGYVWPDTLRKFNIDPKTNKINTFK